MSAEAFRVAVLDGELDTVAELIARGVDPNTRIDAHRPRTYRQRRHHPLGYTALHVAADARDVALGRLLLQHGADPTLRTHYGRVTAVDIAAELGMLALLDTMLTTRSLESSVIRAAVCAAVGAKRRDVVERLFAAGVPKDLGGPLAIALRERDGLPMVELLLAAGAEPQDNDEAPGAWTCRMIALDKCIDALPLLRRFAQPTLFDAVIDGDVVAVADRLAAGESPDQLCVYKLLYPLKCAARLGHLPVLDVLLNAGAALQPLAPEWHNPLLAALVGGHVDCARRLADAGLPGTPLLHHAVQANAPVRALAWLYEHFPHVDLTRALHAAIDYRRDAAMRWLIARADLEARHLGRTALLHAAAVRNESAVDALLAAGADPRAQTAHGGTALLLYIDISDPVEPDDPPEYNRAMLDNPIARKLIAAGTPIPELP